MPNPTTNADNLPSVPLTEEQRYLFDTRGWVLIPGVLSESEIQEMREFCYQLKQEPASIPEHHRYSIGGPLESLTDHPVVCGFMHEFLASAYANENCYGFRLESTFLTIRANGHDAFQPHGGRGMLNFPGNSHTYHLHYDKAHSGLTRVVWELNPVQKGCGGTMFLTGSHKGAFPAPQVNGGSQLPAVGGLHLSRRLRAYLHGSDHPYRCEVDRRNRRSDRHFQLLQYRWKQVA